MNWSMWKKALTIIPEVSPEEWARLDLISRWLIATRSAVLVMTLLSALLAGLLALHDGFPVNPLTWFILALGLVLAHATNNIFNDFVDYVRGVDRDNYFRTLYGPQPVARGLLSRRQHLLYFAVTGLLALACGLFIVLTHHNDPIIWLLIGLGALFVLFYTWPMKGWALGEMAVLIVWGPLMIGGGNYVLTGVWNWKAVLAGLPYALGVTTVLFGKHIDKYALDRARKIHTLPVVIGEKAARYVTLALMVVPYFLVVFLIAVRYFTPVMLLVFLAVPSFLRLYPPFLKPKPESRPEGFPEGQGGWPLYFAPHAFVNNRAFGLWFVLGLVADILLRRLIGPGFWT